MKSEFENIFNHGRWIPNAKNDRQISLNTEGDNNIVGDRNLKLKMLCEQTGVETKDDVSVTKSTTDEEGKITVV